MAKFILDKITVDDDAVTASGSGPDVGIIQNVVVEASIPTIEPNTVIVDNGQTVNESYTVNLEIRTRDTKYRDASGVLTNTNILDGTNISSDGVLKKKLYLKFEGNGGFNIDAGAGMYLNGYEDFSNGRRETVLTGTVEVTSATSGLTSS
jgi:hypothetical protein